MRGVTLGLGLLCFATGCGAAGHLGPGFGHSFAESFTRLSVRPLDEPPATLVTVLDAQEASAVWGGYLFSIAAKGREQQAMVPVLFSVPPPDGLMTSPAMPPPSVPPAAR